MWPTAVRAIVFGLLPASLCTPAWGEWKIWVLPETRDTLSNEPLRFNFGITGMGALRPGDVKVTIYSEADSMLKPVGREGKYEMFAIMLGDSTPEDTFARVEPQDPRGLLLKAEGKTPFNSMYVIPKSPGDKTVTLFLTYKSADGEWRTDTTAFHYRVPAWTESNQTWFTVLVVVAALVVIWKDLLIRVSRVLWRGRTGENDQQATDRGGKLPRRSRKR